MAGRFGSKQWDGPLIGINVPDWKRYRPVNGEKESTMKLMRIGVDLAKAVFQVRARCRNRAGTSRRIHYTATSARSGRSWPRRRAPIARRRSPGHDAMSGNPCTRPVQTGTLAGYEPCLCAATDPGPRRRAVRGSPHSTAPRKAPRQGASRAGAAHGAAQLRASQEQAVTNAHR